MKSLPILLMLTIAFVARADDFTVKKIPAEAGNKNPSNSSDNEAILKTLNRLDNRIDVLEKRNPIDIKQDPRIFTKLPAGDKQIYRPDQGGSKIRELQVPKPINDQNEMRNRIKQLEELVAAQKNLIAALKKELAECKETKQ